MLVPRILVPVDATAGVLESPEKLRLGRPAGPATSTLVPRIVVPVDAGAQPAMTPRHPSSPATVLPRPAPYGAGPSPALFVQAMLENSPTKPKGWAKNAAVSLLVHGIVLGAVLLAPLYFPEAINFPEFNLTLLELPPPPAPPPPLIPAPAPLAQSPVARKKVLPAAAKRGARRLIRGPIAWPGIKPSGTDLAPEVAAGVPAGVPGGQLGGVIGGTLTGGSATASYIPPPPTESPPQKPVRVGGDVKEPRLIYQVQPTYPPLLQKAKVSGDVVIRVVVDPRGNVAEMYPVSGDPQLAAAAMEAVRQWKYAPTIVAGQAVSVELTVTIQFRLT